MSLGAYMKYQRLKVQLWDKDILTPDYMIGDATLSLDQILDHMCADGVVRV